MGSRTVLTGEIVCPDFLPIKMIFVRVLNLRLSAPIFLPKTLALV